MNVIIVGYGRMGHEVEKALKERNHSVSGIVDPFVPEADKKLSLPLLEKADAVIEFSLPEGVIENTSLYALSGVPAVLGTTGWDTERAKVKKIIEEKSGSLIWGYNFSIGAHMFFHLGGMAAEMLNRIPGYDIWLHEIHHNKKKDSPSGTALTAARRIMENYPVKNLINTEKLDRQIEGNELHVSSSRGGHIHGTHTVFLDSANDTIEITHRARNRSGFAAGSVLAAEWLSDKKGFYQVEDFINDLITGGNS